MEVSSQLPGSKVSLVFTGALVSDVEIKGTISTAEADGSYAVTGSFDASANDSQPAPSGLSRPLRERAS